MIDEPFLELYDYISNFKTSSSKILLTIILPMYNEEHTIGKILGNLPKGNSIQIIIIDDHSTDNSLQEIEKVNENND